jgi:hypothetical protein
MVLEGQVLTISIVNALVDGIGRARDEACGEFGATLDETLTIVGALGTPERRGIVSDGFHARVRAVVPVYDS